MTVHILFQGRTLCGIREPPADWPSDHKWLSFLDDDLEKVTCAVCISTAKELGTVRQVGAKGTE